MFIKGWPQQKEVLITKWTRWAILWQPVSLIPQLLLSLPNGLIKWPQWQIWRLRTGSAPRKPTHQANLIITTGGCPIRQQSVLHNDTICQSDSRLMTLDHFYHGRTMFCYLLTGINVYSWYTFAFLAHNASAKTISHRLTKCHIYHYVIPHGTTSDQGTDQGCTRFVSVLYTDGLHKLISFSIQPHEMRSFTIIILQWGEILIVSGNWFAPTHTSIKCQVRWLRIHAFIDYITLFK